MEIIDLVDIKDIDWEDVDVFNNFLLLKKKRKMNNLFIKNNI
jgi:hypothetical protein